MDLYEKQQSKGLKNRHSPRKGTPFLLFWNVKNSTKKCTFTRKTVKRTEKQWKTYIFLGRVHFFCYFEIWKIVKKSVPLREKQSKGLKNIHFLGRVHFFTFFFQVQFWWSLCFHFFSTFFFPGTVRGNLALGPEEPGWIVKISFKVRPSCRGHFRADVPETIRLRETSITIL